MSKSVKKNSDAAFKAPKGMHDILPSRINLFEKVVASGRAIADFYNFRRIETPIMEDAEIFVRSAGKTSDIVEKQMFILKTRGGDTLALRPEGTAPIARAYIEHGMRSLPQPVKLYYFGPMFRHEQPQHGRFRQFNQFGFEILGGESDPIYDAELILAVYKTLEELKLKNLSVQINSIGCRTCQPKYRKKLVDYYRKEKKSLCEDCKRRLAENPLRLLDCKEKSCEEVKSGAPSLLDNLCSPCSKHFQAVLELLDEVSLPYVLNPRLVRGLDYYNRTVFEIFTEARGENGKGFDFALASGGRYDYLIEMVGGRPTTAIGGAIGIERVEEVVTALGLVPVPKPKDKVFLIHVGEEAKKKSFKLIESLRSSNIGVSEALGKDSLGAQLKSADKGGYPFAMIFGQKEVYEGSIILRDMKTGIQETIPLDILAEEVKKRLKQAHNHNHTH